MKATVRRAAALAGCALLAGISSCSQTNADFVYIVTAGTPAPVGGAVFSYGADSASAYLELVGDKSYPSGGVNAVAAVATSDARYVFVVNRDDDTVVTFGVRVGEGTITPLSTANTAGTQPVAVAIDASNSYLYVVDTLAPGFSSTNPGNGDVTVFSIGANATLTEIASYPVGNSPHGVAVLSDGSGMFVANQADSTVSVFAANGTPASGYTQTETYGFGAATGPYAVLAQGSSVYITDFANANIQALSATGSGSALTLTPLDTAASFLNPAAMVIDATGKFLYCANQGSQNITSFNINADGSLTSTGAAYGAGTSPRGIAITPEGGPFLYTANYLDNSVTAYLLDPGTGVLTPAKRSPLQVLGTHPSAIVTVAQSPSAK